MFADQALDERRISYILVLLESASSPGILLAVLDPGLAVLRDKTSAASEADTLAKWRSPKAAQLPMRYSRPPAGSLPRSVRGEIPEPSAAPVRRREDRLPRRRRTRFAHGVATTDSDGVSQRRGASSRAP